MRLSSMADYAIVVMVAAARHRGEARVAAGTVAVETGLPGPTVQRLVSRLTGAGLLRSARGAGGGFELARAADAISVADIVEAVEGPIALTACVEHGRQDCTLGHSCVVRPYWPAVNDALRGALAAVSLTDLSARPAPVVMGSAAPALAGAMEA